MARGVKAMAADGAELCRFIIVRIMGLFWLVAALVSQTLLIGQAAQPADSVSQALLHDDVRTGVRAHEPVLRNSGMLWTMKI